MDIFYTTTEDGKEARLNGRRLLDCVYSSEVSVCSYIVQTRDNDNHPLWARISKNPDWSSLICLHYLLRLCAPLRSVAHLAHSLARGLVNDMMAINSVFFGP